MGAMKTVKAWVTLGLIVLFVLALLGWRSGCQAAKQARGERNVAVATGTALDKVAKETPVIRQDQSEKQRAVDQIEGSDTRLPDGYGDALQRLRDGAAKDSR
jgi:hypothetical protein